MKQLILIFLLITTFSNAQFNTVKPKINPDKKTFEDKIEKPLPKDEPKAKKTIRIFPKTNSIKNEVDSLKLLLKLYNEKVSAKNLKLKKINDSLILVSRIKQSIYQEIMPSKISTIQPVHIQQYPQIETPIYAENEQPKFYLASNGIKTLKKISMPINNLRITSNFGMRNHPIFGNYKMHNGVDFGASYEPVYSVLDGVVTQAGWDSKGGGNFIEIRHTNKYKTKYLHLNKMYYNVGDQVKAGYIIGQSGNTGNSTAPHLHFSVVENGKYVNPINFLNTLIKYNNIISKYYANTGK